MPEPSSLGARLRDIRKRRGLTQQELATASEVSISLIRKLEQGDIEDTRMSTAHKLARALRIPTTQLATRPEPAPGAETPEPWLALRDAVQRPAEQPDDEPSLDAVEAAIPAVRAAREAQRLREAVSLLAPLLRDADALGSEHGARSVRTRLLHMAGAVLTQVHAYDAADTAFRRAVDDAPDRLHASAAVTTWVWLLMRQGRLDEARQLAQRWADDTEPRISRATPDEIAAWGWLLLQGSAAALRDNRPGESADMLRLARAAAVVTGRAAPSPTRPDQPWSPEVVAYKACERGVVLERPDDVLRAAERLKGTGKPGQATDYYRHRLDVAQAHVMLRQHAEAVEVLQDARTALPEWLAQQQYARDIVADVVERRRTLTPEMRELADAVGLPL